MVLPPKSSDREALIREAFLLEWLTIGWMSVEAAIAIASGIMAGSLVVTAFGLDSLIELASGGVLMWRLSVELHYGQAFSEDAERGKPDRRRTTFRPGRLCHNGGANGAFGHSAPKRSLGQVLSWRRWRYRRCGILHIAR